MRLKLEILLAAFIGNNDFNDTFLVDIYFDLKKNSWDTSYYLEVNLHLELVFYEKILPKQTNYCFDQNNGGQII